MTSNEKALDLISKHSKVNVLGARYSALISAKETLEFISYLNSEDNNFPKIQRFWEDIVLILDNNLYE